MDIQKESANEFDAAMNRSEFKRGELNHREMEKKRLLFMTAALTKSSEKLGKSCELEFGEFTELMRMGADLSDHYTDVVELLAECMTRLYEVYKKHEHIDPTLLGAEDREAIQEIVKYSAKIDAMYGDVDPDFH